MVIKLAAAEVAETTEKASSFVANVDWNNPTWDLFIILFFIIAAFIYGLSLGRDRVIAILVSVYMALAVVNAAPFIGNYDTEIGVANIFVLRLSTFVAVLVLLFFLLSRSALLATVANSDAKGSWWQVLLFSFLHVGLIVSIVLSLLPDSFVAGLTPLTQTIFTTELARFLWIVAPIAAMILIRGGASDKKRFKYDI
ncbi:MAG: hypothetical protein V1838_01065 [Patescibacteria group bacterium]